MLPYACHLVVVVHQIAQAAEFSLSRIVSSEKWREPNKMIESSEKYQNLHVCNYVEIDSTFCAEIYLVSRKVVQKRFSKSNFWPRVGWLLYLKARTQSRGTDARVSFWKAGHVTVMPPHTVYGRTADVEKSNSKKMKNGSISERVYRVRREIGSILMIAGQNKQDQVKHVVFLRSDVLCEVACRCNVRKYQTLKKYS